jgi:hypothetical protein
VISDVAMHVVNCPAGVNLRVRLYREAKPDSHIYEKKLDPTSVTPALFQKKNHFHSGKISFK